ncbi:hypothetical protein CEXT_402791 [Caerostris extrusa]|uniref:Uncharacterized protein n=1 Tax=Caerostris extrusa TaxID=172846 RepID=A0AAV4XR55_CAEEX|nr:hypothetical protein CEXT_402791 [Caerostris extrusa]
MSVCTTENHSHFSNRLLQQQQQQQSPLLESLNEMKSNITVKVRGAAGPLPVPLTMEEGGTQGGSYKSALPMPRQRITLTRLGRGL